MCDSDCYNCQHGVEVHMYTRKNGELEYFDDFKVVWCERYVLSMFTEEPIYSIMDDNCNQYEKI